MEEQSSIIGLQNQLIEQNQELKRVQEQLVKETAARKEAEERLQTELAATENTLSVLRENEQHYKMLLENTHDSVYAVTPEGIMTYISPPMIQLGYTPGELISKNFINYVAPEQRNYVIKKFKSGTVAGDSFPTEFQWIKKNGERTWIEVVGKTVFDESGAPLQQIGVIRDINERKQQEESFRSLLLLLDTLDAECFIKDNDGIYQYINKAFEKQFNVKRDDVIGKDDVVVFGAETAAMLHKNDQRIMASRKTESVEESTYLQDGKFVVYLTIKTPIIDDHNKVSGICGVGIDITHQKDLENKLRQSENKYRSLVEQISEVIYSVDLDGVITYISPAIEPFLGYIPSEVIGQAITKFISPEELEYLNDNFQRLSTGSTPGPKEYKTRTKSGEVRWMRTSSHPVKEGDQVVGIQGVLADITGNKMSEKQITEAAATTERERLARELHDSVTQTLYSVAAIAEALPYIKDRNPEETERGLQELRTLSHAALAEMRTLLLELRPHALDHQTLTELLEQLSRGLMARTNMPVNLNIKAGCPMPNDVKIALYRIVQEALNNIIKHARATKSEVFFEYKPGLARLEIVDDGVGFNPENVASHRLGLDIMRERSQEIGAEFKINSQPDGGTSISVVWHEK